MVISGGCDQSVAIRINGDIWCLGQSRTGQRSSAPALTWQRPWLLGAVILPTNYKMSMAKISDVPGIWCIGTRTSMMQWSTLRIGGARDCMQHNAWPGFSSIHGPCQSPVVPATRYFRLIYPKLCRLCPRGQSRCRLNRCCTDSTSSARFHRTSIHGGFHKWGYPKWVVYTGKSHEKRCRECLISIGCKSRCSPPDASWLWARMAGNSSSSFWICCSGTLAVQSINKYMYYIYIYPYQIIIYVE